MGAGQNDQTPYKSLPLPAPDNRLEQDVLRLREALAALDGELLRIDESLDERATVIALRDGLAGVWQSIAGAQAQIDTLKTGKVASINGKEGVAVTLLREDLKLGPANGPTSCAISYDTGGRVNLVVETVDGKPSTQTMEYNADGTVKAITTIFKNRTRKETFSYDNGRISGTTATEVQA